MLQANRNHCSTAARQQKGVCSGLSMSHRFVVVCNQNTPKKAISEQLIE
jgi:hypothetical protein